MAKKAGKKSKPFRLFDVPFKTQGGFNAEVNRRASAVYQPKLQGVSQDFAAERRTNRGQQGLVQRMGGAWQDQLNSAFGQATNALSTLATANAPNDQARDTLRAALGAATGRVNTEAARLGGAPQPLSQATETAGLQGATAGNNYLSGLAMNILGGQNQFRNTVPQAVENEALLREAQRHAGKTTELETQKKDILGQVGGLRSQARSDLMSELLKQRAQKYQEFIGNREFGLKTKEFGLQSELGRGELGLKKKELGLQTELGRGELKLKGQQLRSSNRQAANELNWKKYVDSATLAQGQQQLNDARDMATGTAEEKNAEVTAGMYARGAAAVDSFLSPNDADFQEFRKRVHGRTRTVKERSDQLYRKNRKPEQLYSALKRLGLPQKMIFKLMSTVRIPGFANYLKNKRIARGDYSKGGPQGTGYIR